MSKNIGLVMLAYETVVFFLLEFFGGKFCEEMLNA
jgi:hypothetical protein